MDRRIVSCDAVKAKQLTDINLLSKTEWSHNSLIQQLKVERKQKKKQLKHNIWRKAIADKAMLGM